MTTGSVSHNHGYSMPLRLLLSILVNCFSHFLLEVSRSCSVFDISNIEYAGVGCTLLLMLVVGYTNAVEDSSNSLYLMVFVGLSIFGCVASIIFAFSVASIKRKVKGTFMNWYKH